MFSKWEYLPTWRVAVSQVFDCVKSLAHQYWARHFDFIDSRLNALVKASKKSGIAADKEAGTIGSRISEI